MVASNKRCSQHPSVVSRSVFEIKKERNINYDEVTIRLGQFVKSLSDSIHKHIHISYGYIVTVVLWVRDYLSTPYKWRDSLDMIENPHVVCNSSSRYVKDICAIHLCTNKLANENSMWPNDLQQLRAPLHRSIWPCINQTRDGQLCVNRQYAMNELLKAEWLTVV